MQLGMSNTIHTGLTSIAKISVEGPHLGISKFWAEDNQNKGKLLYHILLKN